MVEVFAEGEDTLALRLANKLADLRAEYATSFVHTHEWIRIEHVDKKREGQPRRAVLCGGIRRGRRCSRLSP